MNPIFEAIESGYPPDEILGFLSKAIPQMGSTIKKAKRFGYPAKQILGFLSKNFETENRRGMSESERHAVNKRSDAERTKFGLKAVGAAVASPIAAKVVGNALSRALPSLPGLGLNPNSSQTALPLPGVALSPETNIQSNHNVSNPLQAASAPTQGMPQQPGQSPNVSSQPPVNPPIVPQSSQNAQPINPQRDIKKNIDLLKNLGEDKRVQNLIEGGMSKEDIAGVLRKVLPKEKVKALEAAEGGIEQAIEDMASLPKEQEISQTEIPIEEPSISSDEIIEPEPVKIEPKSTVATPHGVGEVKAIREKSALVEIDGKTHKIPIEDLEQEPEEIVQTVQELLKIPEVDRSSVVSLFTYDPIDKQMFIQFHNGDTTKYFDVDPEKVMKIADKMGIPVTEGKNIFGAWSPEDKKSLGATLIKEIINDPKYKKAKKGEAANPNYRNLETLYDYWEKLRKKPKRKRL